MATICERRYLIFSLGVFEDLLKGPRNNASLPHPGQPDYPKLLAHLSHSMSSCDVENLAELYPTVSKDQWRYVCDFGIRSYFQPYLRCGELSFTALEGAKVVVRWDIESPNDIQANLEHALAEALSDGFRVRDIADMARQIEEKMWHDQ